MGNHFVKEERAAPPVHVQREINIDQAFELKSQFLECWSIQDVQAWLKYCNLGEFAVALGENGCRLDGDGVIHVASTLLRIEEDYNFKLNEAKGKNTDENNNNNNNIDDSGNNSDHCNAENSEKQDGSLDKDTTTPKSAIPKNMVALLDRIAQVSKPTFSNLVLRITQLALKYESQLVSAQKEDQAFPPYEYPVFAVDEPKNRNRLAMFYHDKTQHTQTQGSRSVERRWFSQPRIYRRYYGSPYTKLPLPTPPTTSTDPQLIQPPPTTPYNTLFLTPRPPTAPPRTLTQASLSEFLYFSLSVSGRRDLWTLTSSPRSAWVKRVNPSSGGLHPIECYVLLPANTLHENTDAALYHYAVRHHGLERRRSLGRELWSKLGVDESESFFIGISSIHWREVWKYGERGFRYCMLDAGHALGSLAVSAAKLGWKISFLPFLDTDLVETLLGISDSNRFVNIVEKERGLMIAVVNTAGKSLSLSSFPDVSEILGKGTWDGAPNHLSSVHFPWEIVNIVDNATIVEKTDRDSLLALTHTTTKATLDVPLEVTATNSQFGMEALTKLTEGQSCENVIVMRRSALDFINKPIGLDQFVHIMVAILRSASLLNFPWAPLANLFIFAYQVKDLTPGLYVLIRNENELEELKQTTKGEGFAWSTPISSLPLYFLKAVDKEQLSSDSYEASCHQHIAKQGAFSLGMLVHLERAMDQMGPNGYCRSHFECGAIGQVLYLEAHALGLGATGMGCYLDDYARITFGLQQSPFWSLYHFAVGVPSHDNRYAPYNYAENMFEGVLDECVACVRPRN